MSQWEMRLLHWAIFAMVSYVARALHVNGIKFDIRIWRNGKKKDDQEAQ